MNLSALLLSFAFLQTALSPQDSAQFFFTPDTESVIVLTENTAASENTPVSETAEVSETADTSEMPSAAEFILNDVNGTEIRRVHAEVSKNEEKTEYTLKMSLPQGYYELLSPASKQAFGIVSLPAFCAENTADIQKLADPFFAIDGATSWLVRCANFDVKRDELARIARRSGIGMIRERLRWNECQRQAGAENIDFESGCHYDSSRKTMQRHGVLVLELCHDAPDWMPRTAEKYPKDLISAQKSWEVFTARWNRTWGGMEVWNEPDISFAANLPADQYVPLLKTIAYVQQNSGAEAEKLAETGSRTPLVSGVMASYNRPWLDAAAECGILENSDVFSFHTYALAPAVENIYSKFQDWLRTSGQPTKPLWLTECGRPWSIGPGRPPQEQDLRSAIDIVMKGVEAKAFGITRYFPFVFPYYEERVSNFGMMSRDYTPLRSFAAYAQSVRVLAHLRYLGDWNSLPEGWTHARVFGFSEDEKNVRENASLSPEECLVVFYAPTFEKRTLKLPCGILRAERATGEKISLSAEKNALETLDGFVYVWIRKSDVKSFLNAETHMMKMLSERSATTSEMRTKMKENISPIVLRYNLDEKNVTWTPAGYEFSTNCGEEIPLEITAVNLSKDEKTIPVQVNSPFEDTKIQAPADITVPAEGSVSFVIKIVPGVSYMNGGSFNPIEITAEDRIVVKIRTKASLEQLLSSASGTVRLDLRDFSRWTPSSGCCDVLKFAKSGETWLLMTHFTPGDHWVYPGFKLPEEVNLKDYSGVILRARSWDCKKKTQIRFFAYQPDGAFFTSDSIIPVDGEWNTVKIPFSSLVLCSAAGGNAAEFHPENVRKISIGGNTEQDVLMLEVSDCFLYKEK